MKRTKLALAAMLGCALYAADAAAQAPARNAAMRHAGLHYDYYAQPQVPEASPSDRPAPPPAAAFQAQDPYFESVGDSYANGDCCTSDPCGCPEAEPDPWRLFCQDGCWTFTGWLAAGGTYNARQPASGYNGPVTFNDRDEVQFHQAYAVLEKAVDTDSCCWDIGGRVDLLWGSDYIFTQAAGLETRDDFSPHWNGHTQYGLAIPQAYAELGYRGLSLKLGHFYTIMGYEVVQAPGNFFYSHAYTHQYGEPFTHTGGLATYQWSDQTTLYGGIVNGWDKFDAETDRAAFLSGSTYTPDHGVYTIASSFIIGEEDGAAPPITGTRTLWSLVFTYNVTENLQYVLNHDNGWQENGGDNGLDAEWYGLNQYLLYTINDCWKAGIRGEWFRDDDGTRVAGVRDFNPIQDDSYAGNFYNITAGLNWLPNDNFRLRPELRWDWYDGLASGGDAPLPYDDGFADSQFTMAMDGVLLW